MNMFELFSMISLFLEIDSPKLQEGHCFGALNFGPNCPEILKKNNAKQSPKLQTADSTEGEKNGRKVGVEGNCSRQGWGCEGASCAAWPSAESSINSMA